MLISTGASGFKVTSRCGFTRVIVTLAIPRGLRLRVPANITSSIRLPRRLLADCSPRTQLIASLKLDLPHPLGPTTAAIPLPLNRSSVLSQKDLNPCSSIRFNFSTVQPHVLGGLIPRLDCFSTQEKVPAYKI